MKNKKERIHPHTARYIIGIWEHSKLETDKMALYHVIWYNNKPSINAIKNAIIELLDNGDDQRMLANSFFDMYDRETTNEAEMEIIQFIDNEWLFSTNVKFLDIDK